MIGRAVISTDGLYRYALWRSFEPAQLDGTDLVVPTGTVLFVMLNPSTATGREDDPTVKRCMNFASDWGYRRLAVANLYAGRATKPELLNDIPDPVGPFNDEWLRALAASADVVVAAWGATPAPNKGRAEHVLGILGDCYALGVTKDDHPKHPLYVKGDTELVPYSIGG